MLVRPLAALVAVTTGFALLGLNPVSAAVGPTGELTLSPEFGPGAPSST